jgi:hypothetical protein
LRALWKGGACRVVAHRDLASRRTSMSALALLLGDERTQRHTALLQPTIRLSRNAEAAEVIVPVIGSGFPHCAQKSGLLACGMGKRP